MSLAEALPCWAVVLCLLSRVSWTLPAEGQPHLIGFPRLITAAPGDDVILPCHLKPQADARWLTLEWTRVDVKPDPLDRLRQVGYVYFRRGGVELRDMKIPSYADRAALFADELKLGDMSLSIRNLTSADEGTYRCFVPSLTYPVFIQLVIDSKSHGETWTTEVASQTTTNRQTPDPGVVTNANDGRKRPILWILPLVSIVSLLATAVVFIVQRKHRRRDDVRDEQTMPLDQSKPFAA